MLKKLLPIIILCCVSFLTFAQIEEGGIPKSLLSHITLSEEIPVIVMPTDEIDMPKLLAEDDEDLAANLPLRFAHRFYQNHNLENAGVWETLPNGDRVWRLTIWSPGAMSITLGYSDFYLPVGAKFYVYSAYDATKRIGAFTAKNNKDHHQFTTRPVHDDKITLEYYEPQNVQGQGAIEVAVIGHAYRDIDGRTMSEKSGPCQVSINCAEGLDWQDEKKGVARIVIDMAFLCSGTLIANTNQDGIPYFSTANHCIASTGHDALGNSLVPLWTFFWNYECMVGSCDNGEPGDDCAQDPEETTVGGNIVASSGGPGQAVNIATEFGDFALILLDESPVTAGYDVFFNGWDRSGPTETYEPSECIGIHHPAGDVKKISTDINGASVESTGQYWDLFWEPTANGHSVTEGGSSGSPLFDKMTGRVIGQLLGGGSVNCDDPANDRALYGGFFYTFTNEDNPAALAADGRKLEPWLDPNNSGVLFVEGHYPDGTIPPPPVPKVVFKTPTSDAAEMSDVTPIQGCTPYRDYSIDILLTRLPDEPVTLTVEADADNSSAEEGTDFTIMNNTVTLGQDAMQLGTVITVRVNDDAVVENLENILLTYTIDENYMGNAIPGTGNQEHNLMVVDNDLTPQDANTQVQTLFEDNFDDITTSWTTSNGLVHTWTVGDNTADTDAAGMTSNCAYVTFNGDYAYNNIGTTDELSILSEAIDATSLTDLNLSFDWATSGEVGFDFGELVFSTDGSTTEPFSPAVILVDNGLAVTENIQLPPALENTTFHIGFIWKNDETAGEPQPLAFDNVKVTGTSVSAADVAVTMGASVEAELAPMTTVHFYDDSGNIMMSIRNLDANHNFGCTTVDIDRVGTGHTDAWEDGKSILDKSFRVNVENNAINVPYEISLYYTDAEIQGWLGNPAGDDLSVLKMVKTSGAIADGTPSNYSTSTATATTYNSDHIYTATFDNGFSGFSLGNVSEPIVLAVELLDFAAQAQDKSIVLEWTSQSETDHKGFEIQRSTQANNKFEAIDWTDSKGTSAATYRFEDFSVQAGQVYYYRLKQVDFSEKATYSTIVSAEVVSMLTTQVMPNPVHHTLGLSLNPKQPIQGQVQLIDLMGRELWTATFEAEQTLNLRIPMVSFSDGIYFLRVMSNGEVLSTEKIIKE